jgi:hypothetical protein
MNLLTVKKGDSMKANRRINMNKTIFALFMMLLIFPSLALAESCINLVGTWDITGDSVYHYYDPIYVPINEGRATVAHITSQNGCLFGGYIEMFQNGYAYTYEFTGAINKKAIIITLDHAIMNGTITKSNKISFVCSMFTSADDYMTMKGTAIKR